MAEKRSPPEDILSFRDGAPTNRRFRRELQRDGEALLALADARLLALALALPIETETSAEWPMPDDSALVSYLLNTVTGDECRELERRLRGNPRAFKRLLELREVLTSPSAQDDDALPAGFPPPVSRESLGTVHFQRANGLLEFAPEVTTFGKMPEGSERFFARILAGRPSVAADFAASRSSMRKEPPNLWSVATEVRNLAAVIERLSIALRLSGQTLVRPHAAVTISPLADMADALARAADDLARRVSVAAKLAPPALPTDEEDLSLGAADVPVLPQGVGTPRYLAFEAQATGPGWQSKLPLRSSQALVGLSGTATEMPWRIQLQLQRLDGSAWSGILATLVRPRQRFDSAETDPDGLCYLPLREGESVLLIETERPLELRLRSST